MTYCYNLIQIVVFGGYRYEKLLEGLVFLWITVIVCVELCTTNQRQFVALYHCLKPKSHDV